MVPSQLPNNSFFCYIAEFHRATCDPHFLFPSNWNYITCEPYWGEGSEIHQELATGMQRAETNRVAESPKRTFVHLHCFLSLKNETKCKRKIRAKDSLQFICSCKAMNCHKFNISFLRYVFLVFEIQQVYTKKLLVYLANEAYVFLFLMNEYSSFLIRFQETQ